MSEYSVSSKQYVSINVQVSCFTIIALQENITFCMMLNYLCTEPYLAFYISVINLSLDELDVIKRIS